MKRRNFLKYTSAGIVIPSLTGGLGARALGFSPLTASLTTTPANDNVIVLIYLNGGNDGLNTVIPLSQLSPLNTVRPHVIMPESKLLRLEGTEVALHPSMQGFKNLFEEERLQIVQGVGYPNQNFSHFRSTDIWMSGSDANVLLNSGLAGRYLNYEYPNYPLEYPNTDMPDPLAVEIGWNSSLLFQGPNSSMGMVINNPDSFYQLVENTVDEAPDNVAGDKIEYIRLIAQQSQVYGEVVKAAAGKVPFQSPYPETDLAQQLKIVAKLIAGGLKTKLYLVQLGGFDTHDAQVMSSDHTKGEHANLLKTLSEAVSAFMKDCDGLGISDRVMGMTFSEFGRRIISNASLGTDHGAAAPQFLFGNHVNAGVLGSNPIIPTNANYESNLDMQYDFRQLYASLFEQWFCMNSLSHQDFMFGNFTTLPLTSGAACSPTSTSEVNQLAGKSILDIAPNPVRNYMGIQFESDGSPVVIKLYDMNGRQIAEVLRGTYPSGRQRVEYDAGALPSGNYFVKIVRGRTDQTKLMIKI